VTSRTAVSDGYFTFMYRFSAFPILIEASSVPFIELLLANHVLRLYAHFGCQWNASNVSSRMLSQSPNNCSFTSDGVPRKARSVRLSPCVSIHTTPCTMVELNAGRTPEYTAYRLGTNLALDAQLSLQLRGALCIIQSMLPTHIRNLSPILSPTRNKIHHNTQLILSPN
jgi:hypothetical protein